MSRLQVLRLEGCPYAATPVSGPGAGMGSCTGRRLIRTIEVVGGRLLLWSREGEGLHVYLHGLHH